MAKKIISFLGNGDYKNTKYSFTNLNGEKKIIETRFIQEVISNLVGKEVVLYIGLTEGDRGSRKTNWESGEKLRFNKKTSKKEAIYEIGLKKTLREKDISFKEMSIRDGKNDSEIWENFQIIYDELEEGDEIYVDVTHSFRSIPIIIMAILNYAKFIKNIDVKGIYYGAFEAREEPELIAPILDLSLFNDITDWTIGAEKFISTGDVTSLGSQVSDTIRAYKKEIQRRDKESDLLRNVNKSLEDFANSLYTVRGPMISDYGNQLKKNLKEVKDISIDELKPFGEILNLVYGKVSFYSGEKLRDVHYTVKLCKDLNLIQQAYTLLRENLVNFVALAAGINIEDEDKRMAIENIILSRRAKAFVRVRDENLDMEEKVKEFVNEDIGNLFDRIGKYRNDLNHGGYRAKYSKADTFNKTLEELINSYESIIDIDNLKLINPDKSKDAKNIDVLNPNMILLFSHKLTEEQKEKAKEEFKISEFIYLPDDLQNKWSSIDPSLDNIDEELTDIKSWILKTCNANDYVLIQGDYGAMHKMVNFSREEKLIPIYSTSQRQAKEVRNYDGKIEISHIFQHVRFRKY